MVEEKPLLRLEKQLKERDAVMEPGVLDRLRQYVGAGGNPKTAIEMLCENYRGAPPRRSRGAAG